MTRLLHRMEPDSTSLWEEAKQHVTRDAGILIVDDTTLDKPYAHHIALVHRLWSGKHHQVVQGINVVTLLWSDGERCIPVDYRLYDKPTDGATKNDHFRAMLATANTRGFRPRLVAFDSWYGSLENLKTVRDYHGSWLTRSKATGMSTPTERPIVRSGRLSLARQARWSI